MQSNTHLSQLTLDKWRMPTVLSSLLFLTVGSGLPQEIIQEGNEQWTIVPENNSILPLFLSPLFSRKFKGVEHFENKVIMYLENEVAPGILL